VVEQRLVFGSVAELYDRARPSYPPELVERLVELAGLPGRVVDAGCGTGKAAVLLAARGFEGVGVDPDPAMAALAARRLEAFPGWRVEISDFERWEGEPPFELVISAQAWHWIDPEAGARQAARLLGPGGWLAIFGHVPRRPDTDLRRELDAIYAELAPMPSARSRAPTARIPPGTAFSEPFEEAFPVVAEFTTEGWIDRLRTSSDHIILPEGRREELLARIAAAIDARGGTYVEHGDVRLWAARRL
jgi:SAM-dependent methyltransferase